MTLDAADRQERGSSQAIDYAQRLNEIKDKISDKKLNEQEKAELNGKLDEAFRSGLLEYMESTENQETLTEFKNSLSNFLNEYSDENKDSDEAYKSLMTLADIMWLEKVENWNWSEKKKESTDAQADSPEFELVWKLDGVQLSENETDRMQDFRNWVMKEKPREWEKEPEEKLRLYAVIENWHGIGGRIDELLKNTKLTEEDKQKLNDIQTLGENISNVLKDTSPDNVRALQKFIYDNVYKDLLDDTDKTDFEVRNHMKNGGDKAWDFDGQFWEITLKWLKALCDKIDHYVKDLENKVKETEGGPSDTLSGVDTDGSWNEGQSDTQSDAAPSQPQDPIKLKDWSHQAISTSSTIAQNAGLNWAVFYAAEVSDGNSSQDAAELPSSGECLMKFGDKTYKVKLDSSNNLCPILEDVNVPEKKLLLENNQSCIDYLTGMLPNELKNKGIKIMWFDGDYVIWKDWYSKWLTIEPMTIDWKWLSAEWGTETSLSDSLAFLNFTNFLRNEWKIQGVEFRNNHPDLKMHNNELYVRVNKNSNKKLSKENWEEKGELWWKWQKVNIGSFWLPALDSKAFQNFIKYNNGEDWNDKWDKKEDNKWYKKISLSGEAIVAPVVQGNPGNWASLGDVDNQYVWWDVVVNPDAWIIEAWNQNDSMSLLVISKPVLAGDNFDTLKRRDAQIAEVWAFYENGDEWFIISDGIKNSETWAINYKDNEYNEVRYNENGEPESSDFGWKWYESWSIDLEDDKKLKFFFIWEYKNGLKNWNWIMVFENWATYEWNFKDGKINWDWTYRYPNGDIYKWAFSDGKITSNNAEYTWNDSLVQYKWGFSDGKITKWEISFTEWGSEITYDVVMDEKWLKIVSEWDNNGKYFDVKTWVIIEETQGQ